MFFLPVKAFSDCLPSETPSNVILLPKEVHSCISSIVFDGNMLNRVVIHPYDPYCVDITDLFVSFR